MCASSCRRGWSTRRVFQLAWCTNLMLHVTEGSTLTWFALPLLPPTCMSEYYVVYCKSLQIRAVGGVCSVGRSCPLIGGCYFSITMPPLVIMSSCVQALYSPGILLSRSVTVWLISAESRWQEQAGADDVWVNAVDVWAWGECFSASHPHCSFLLLVLYI